MPNDIGQAPTPSTAEQQQNRIRSVLQTGDPDQVRALIASGADIHGHDANGYDALIQATYGRDLTTSARLIELLRVLIAHNVNLSGESSYGESGLRRFSHIGRFDAVRVLLEAGADRGHLEWTPLHEAVALGTIDDVESILRQTPELEAKDWCDRTALLMAVFMGDLEKAKLLHRVGANLDARGRCEQPVLHFAIESGSLEMVRWLVEQGIDPHQTDDTGNTPLLIAVQADHLPCVDFFLAHGASLEVQPDWSTYAQQYPNDLANHEDQTPQPVIRSARSRAMILRLLEAGADPAHCNSFTLLQLPDIREEALDGISLEEYQRAHTRRFGNSNPEWMREPYWEAMARSGLWPNAAWRYLGKPEFHFDGPSWCASRFGQSWTLLADGRGILIGGEHEDYYDPDFCIYNDVIVHCPDGTTRIYGYPELVFPPTDFHTATLVDESIIIIGSLGYQGTRRFGETPVYRLHLDTMRMERVEARGESPGWIHRHRAALVSENRIRVWGGVVASENEGQELHAPNTGVYLLDLAEGRWTRSDSASQSFQRWPFREAEEQK